jgi:deoxyribose-phosphate aldolase
MPSSSVRQLLAEVGAVDKVAVEARAASFTTRSIKKTAKLWGLRTAISMVDLTTLEGQDTPGRISQLCAKALHPHAPNPDIPPVAAVCVYPALVSEAKRHVAGSPVRVASVATAFPSGQTPWRTRLAEVRAAVAAGADEIDMVLNRNAFLCGRLGQVSDEIAEVVEACGGDESDAPRLKVILETGEIGGYDQIRAASFLALRSGLRPGDFIKTSTGKTGSNATLANTQVMLEAIRDHYLDTGIPIGMKPAGGIRTAKLALHFLVAVKETLGDEWLNSTRYRFGASALLNDLLRQFETLRTGAYQAAYTFSESAGSY